MRCILKLVAVVLIAMLAQVMLEGLPRLFAMAASDGDTQTVAAARSLQTAPGPVLGWLDRTMGGAAWDVNDLKPDAQATLPLHP